MVVTTQGQRLPHRGTPGEFPWEPELSASMILFFGLVPADEPCAETGFKTVEADGKTDPSGMSGTSF